MRKRSDAGRGKSLSATTTIGLFCSAADDLPVTYQVAAREFGRLCAVHNLRLVYGGSGRGLMGLAAEAAMQGGGQVIGVMPRHLFGRERAETRLADLRLVADLSERKQMMADLSDVFFVLPGGVGTLDEALEMITWYDIGLHRKTTVFVDIDGFWGPLLAVFDHFDRQKMLRAHVRGGFDRIENVAEMPAAAARYSGRAAASRIED